MKNPIVRRTLFENELTQKQAAERLGMTRESFNRKLREEMPISEQRAIVEKLLSREENDR